MVFDFDTPEILESELNAIHEALIQREIDIHPHAFQAARDEQISALDLLSAVLIGIPVEKDLPNNSLNRFPGIAFEHLLEDKRWIKVKVTELLGLIIITAHTIRR